MIYIAALISFITTLVILYLVRRDCLSLGYSLWWLAIALGLMVTGLFPQCVDIIGGVLGIHYPPTLLVIVALCLVLIKLLHMDIERTRLKRDLRILSQRIAVVEYLANLQAEAPPDKDLTSS